MIIDRTTPTLRPERPLAGYQRWRSLLFLHWEIAPAALRRVVPRDLDLDDFGGRYYIGIVPFAMEGVRASWWPERLSLAFLETNVRTYVRYQGRPGVYFLSLDAHSQLAVSGARWRWSLPYYYSRMKMTQNSGRTSYELQRRGSQARLNVSYHVGDHLGPSQPGTQQHFLLERYLLFVEHGGAIYEGQVHHPPYPAQSATVLEYSETLLAAAQLPAAVDPPIAAHYVQGVDVEVFALRRSNDL